VTSDLSSDVTKAITEFLTGARWFGGKGRELVVSDVRRVGEVPSATAGPRTAIDLVTVRYEDGTEEIYQLPLAFYPERDERLDHALVGEWDDPDFGPCHVYDALHDRDAMAGWLAAFAAPPPQGALTFRAVEGCDHEFDLEVHSTLFSGEQSNSSVAFGDDSLMKVFRRLTPGVNPDIEIHEALTRSGSEHVAALYGWLETELDGEVLHLAMLQQFLRTASDGFELAKASVRNLFAEADLHADEVGGDFASESARLGEAVAHVHELLAEDFPTGSLDRDGLESLVRGMHGRLAAALAVVPDLAAAAPRVRATYDALAELGDVPIQRIHGDLHLGQTLRTVKGWKIVDFEGEPAKPLHERVRLDSTWRDVAGMLRSFDYAPAVVERGTAETDDQGAAQRAYRAGEWTGRNRTAFLTAYAGHELTDSEQLLLAAYEADKAVYEAVYETRNRPSWVPIPLAALARLGAA
jgi:maltokinase